MAAGPQFVDTANGVNADATHGILKRLVPFIDGKDCIHPAIAPPSPSCAYTWDQQREPGAQPIPRASLKCVKLYGTHSCGYVLFFKPTLYEVAQLVASHPELTAGTGTLYVDTDPCATNGVPTMDVIACSNRDETRHYAVTTVYYH